MTKVGHRSSEDEQWQDLKKACRLRDHGACRCCSILTPEEIAERNKEHLPDYLLTPCDVAHIEAVGGHVEKTYDLDNVVFLCRACHTRLDSYSSPVTGKPISREEHDEWWKRIKGEKEEMIPEETVKSDKPLQSVISYLDEGPEVERFDPIAWLDS